MTPHLVAIAFNCVSDESAEIMYLVAEQDHDGNWRETFTSSVIYPFWTQSINGLFFGNPRSPSLRPLELPQTLPEGWIDHIQEIARIEACRRGIDKGTDLIQRLGLQLANAEPMRRI